MNYGQLDTEVIQFELFALFCCLDMYMSLLGGADPPSSEDGSSNSSLRLFWPNPTCPSGVDGSSGTGL